MDLLERFRNNLKEKCFAPAGQTVLLAVSGGSDSMVMANLFLQSGLSFAVAHCNFQLRGHEADLDEQLVEHWAKQNKIEFHKVRFETARKSEEWKKGTQETARILRYEWLERIRYDYQYSNIATAHHANDNAETLLINLFRGTGISGLHGIPPVNGNIIRPLLFADKEAITEYIKATNIQYREDASNASDAYLRNAIRHKILPAAKDLFPNIIDSLNDSINRFSQAEMLYKKAIEHERKQLIEQRGQDYYVPILKLRHRQPLDTICYELFLPFGFASAQVPQIVHLLTAVTGHYVLSNTHRIIRNRDFLIVTTIATDATDIIAVESAPSTIDTGRQHFHFSVEKKPEVLPTAATIACIDLDKIEFPLILRKWRIGDYFYPLGMKMKKQKLSRYFINAKIPLHEKEHIWVLECRKRIVWVTGMRLDERFKISDNTKKILKVSLKKKDS